jgi:hypothetical protein
VRPLLIALAIAAGVPAGHRRSRPGWASHRGAGGDDTAAQSGRLFKGLIGDPRVPRSSKALLLFGAAWIASPIDLIPEFIPLLGPLDDAVVAALILRRLVRTAGEGGC